MKTKNGGRKRLQEICCYSNSEGARLVQMDLDFMKSENTSFIETGGTPPFSKKDNKLNYFRQVLFYESEDLEIFHYRS